MKTQLAVLSLVVLGATIFAPSAKAQRRGAFQSGYGGRSFGHQRRGGRFYAGSAYAPYLFSDYDYDSESGMTEAPPPQMIVVQTAQPASPAPAPNPPEPLVLELRGDRWVRITNYGESETDGQSGPSESERASNLPSAPSSAASRRNQAAEPSIELPPAVLVFRDGHKEEIGKYMIMGSTLYTSADYWTSGSWTRKVQIAELDVPATLKLNQERGAKFNLPSGPNEVMIRQ